jgi:hypothetical protein
MNSKIYTLKYLLLFLLVPSFVLAQQNLPVTPLTSGAYQRLIHADSTGELLMPVAPLPTVPVDGTLSSGAQKLHVRTLNNRLLISSPVARFLLISGGYSATVALKTINRLPALQTTYSQGRSMNGNLAWQGSETGEMFSYGPALSGLEFNGQPYPYDINGKLVAAGTGDGRHANAYTGNIFRHATLFSQSFNLNTSLQENGLVSGYFNIRLGHSTEQTFIQTNNNYNKNLQLSLGRTVKWLRIAADWNYYGEQFSNSNRNGFLNRAYQQAILTPVTFDNGQGYTLGAGQRSYGSQADNPWFLLSDNNNYFRAREQRAALMLERNAYRQVIYRISQSYENRTENSNEGYKPGAAGYPAGLELHRNKTDRLYLLTAEAIGKVLYGIYGLDSKWIIRDIFSESRSDINYQPGAAYAYQRSTNEINARYETSWTEHWRWRFDLNLGNKIYLSNTGTTPHYFLPDANFAVTHPLSASARTFWELKLFSTFVQSAGELPLNRSLAYINLLQYRTGDLAKYNPVQEVANFDHLDPVLRREWTNGVNIYTNKFNFGVSVFMKDVEHDPFPVNDNGRLLLKNMADHRTTGIDVEAGFNTLVLKPGNKKLTTTHTLSLSLYRNKVTRVYDHYNYTPIAGFSNVYTTLVEGQPLGVITGSVWLRDAAGNRLIGPDGFPMVAKTPAVIGNPTPDFQLKLSNTIQWWRFALNAELDWKQGGQRWNGTRATLDYYGRSGQSAAERNTARYVFPGIQLNGQPNNIPVDFYNPSKPLQENRWVRYGPAGVAEDYIEKASCLRLNTLKLSYRQPFGHVFRELTLSAYGNNLLLWTPYKGVDPEQYLFDQSNTTGLDFFNLPSVKTFGFNVSLQF